ncbi:MAG: 2-amino-4-hydroxy-6-hydroxymethyldihydropteridine diphosphokinase [Candidatus Latescibacterota bacterium]|nr:MAG: 2-amino-4-hydroxy-6-hydroxymethyldihydropteridine diphosphokinase [Candidatus Latescibacterota bacterium]
MFDPRGSDLSADPAYLSLGSNLGERESAVLGVARTLETSGIGRCVRLSSLYETDPVGCPAMDVFINAVVEFESLLCPVDLLKRLKAMEKRMGRRGGRNEPRELDIDILTMGKTLVDTEDLVVPHPRYRERAFVLIPLRELAPRFRCPATGLGIDELIDALPERHGVVRVSGRKTIHV